MGLLIMLSTSFNMNIFQNAMAIEENPYMNNDYSQGYERYYEDNNYRQDYNYAQQQQDQQQQQSSYSYEYNDKKANYNYNNNNDNDKDKYSKYPTKDNKYECQKGPFEGFFVSSVEFCLKDDRTGNQGPPGPTGPTGATGATGPPGINVIDASNYYSVIGETETIEFLAQAVTSTASCDPGDVAISGEYEITPPAGQTSKIGTYEVRVFDSIGEPPTATEWRTIVFGITGTSVQTTVNCFDNPLPHS